jgi:uncharacterized FlaG/YvyC family protein
MTEEEISSTGQFTALSSVEAAASYQPTNTAAQQSSTAAETATANSTAEASVAAASAAKPTKPPSSQEVASAIAKANANLANSNRQMDFRVDAATGVGIVVIRNSQTGVVLQQIPGADILALARMLADWSPGKHMLLDLIA